MRPLIATVRPAPAFTLVKAPLALLMVRLSPLNNPAKTAVVRFRLAVAVRSYTLVDAEIPVTPVMVALLIEAVVVSVPPL